MDKVAFSFSFFYLVFSVSNCEFMVLRISVLKSSNIFPTLDLVTVPPIDDLVTLKITSQGPLQDLSFPQEYCVHQLQISSKCSRDTSPCLIRFSKSIHSSLISHKKFV